MSLSRPVAAIVAVVLIVVSFGGGYWFGKSSSTSAASGFNRGAGGQFQGGQFGGAGARGGARGGANAGGGFVSGTISKNDGQTLTLQSRDGSSKIVITTSSTKAMRMTEGALSDLSVGTDVTVMGSTNSDGSVTAQTIQVRPQPPMGMGSATSTR